MATKKQIEKATDDLYKAVARYVEVHGGSVAVAGGVQIIQVSTDLKYNWTLGIRCTGRQPTQHAPDRLQRGSAVVNPLQSSESAEVPQATSSGR